MSIVVTCDCTMTYRLPDRYAGKRCRCRECGERIRVPRDASPPEETGSARKGRKAKAGQKTKEQPKANSRKRKAETKPGRRAASTTRRVTSQEGEILGDRQELMRVASQAARHVSDSIHQLAPLHSGDRLDRPVGLTPPPSRRVDRPRGRVEQTRDRAEAKARKERKAKAKAKDKEQNAAKQRTASTCPYCMEKVTNLREVVACAECGARHHEDCHDESESCAACGGSEALVLRSKKKQASESEASDDQGSRTARPAKRKAKTGEAPPSKGKKVAKPKRGRATETLRKRSGAARRSYGKRRSSSEEEGEGRRPARKSGNGPLWAVAAIVGGLAVVGGLLAFMYFSGDPGSAGGDLEKKLAHVEELKANHQWEFAKKELDELERGLEQDGDQRALSKLYKVGAGVEKMVQVLALQTDEAKLENLVKFSTDTDPTVRLGCAMELRGIVEAEEAQRALANLAQDSDARVAAAARQGLVNAGGPHSIPYLAEAIEQTAATGGKLGDVALQRAVELYEPEVVPVLHKALELRANMPAANLRIVLERLAELGNADSVPLARKFLEHEDEGVRQAAQAVIDALG